MARAEETVRISVLEGAHSLEVSGSQLSVGTWGEEDDFHPLKRDRASVTLVKGRVAVNGIGMPAGVRLKASGLMQVKGFALRGTVDVKVQGGALLVVNAIPLEDYLAAVLGGEMPPAFPDEALKAQAVAARTYAIQRKIDAYGKPYHLGATVLSQVYGGAGREDARTRAAVDATKGLVLTYDLAPIEAYFHASCGGRTESGWAALGRDLPYLQPVDCPCSHDPKISWSLSVPADRLEKEFHLEAKDLKVSVRSTTGRAITLDDGAHKLDAITLRREIGYDQIKSLNFRIHADGDKVEFTGKGMGHGAGLCQIGAKMYAEQGWTFQQILSHYYPGTELQKMY
jgi:stage II sporulation protein D